MVYSYVLVILGCLLYLGVEPLPSFSAALGILLSALGVFYGLIIENKLNRKVENLEKELDNFENMFFLKMHDMKHDSADSKKN